MSQQTLLARDLRVDFIRGLMLLIIFVDHSSLWLLPGFHWISEYTLHRFSFLDAADVFVCLSGYAAGMVYSRRFAAAGLEGCLRAAGRRCLQLYAAEAALFVVCLAVMNLPLPVNTNLPAELLRPYRETPIQTAFDLLLMRDHPLLLDLLPLYIAFTALTPFAIVLASARLRALIGMMIGCYLAVYATGLLHLNVIEIWDFNPFAWQLAFFGAFLLGRETTQNPGWWASLQSSRWLTTAAVAGLALVLLIRIAPSWPVAALLHTNALRDMVPRTIPLTGKHNMEPLRLINLALWVIVIAAIDPGVKFLRTRLAGVLIACGQSSLAVFCVGTVLNYAGFVLILSTGAGKAAELGWLIVGCLFQYGTAVAWQRLQASRRETQSLWLSQALEEPRTTESASRVSGAIGGSPSRSLVALEEPRTTESASRVSGAIGGSPSRSLVALEEPRTTESASKVPGAIGGSPSRSLVALEEPRTTESASRVPGAINGAPSRSLFAPKAPPVRGSRNRPDSMPVR